MKPHVNEWDKDEIRGQRLVTANECFSPYKVKHVTNRCYDTVPFVLNLLSNPRLTKLLNLIACAVTKQCQTGFQNKVSRKRKSMAI